MTYEDDIRRMVETARPTPTQEEAARQFAESHAAEYAASSEAANAEALRLGRLSARLISTRGRGVQEFPVIERFTRQFKGYGWHIFDAPTCTDENKPDGKERIGLTVSGLVFEFDDVLPNSYYRGKTILHAARFDRFLGRDAIRLMEKEPFMKGVASVIAGHGPYHHNDYL